MYQLGPPLPSIAMIRRSGSVIAILDTLGAVTELATP
jgi:hypothetical protein